MPKEISVGGVLVTHEDAVRAITSADKAALVLALRALATAQLWLVPEASLREMLHQAVHTLSPDEVLNALKNGA